MKPRILHAFVGFLFLSLGFVHAQDSLNMRMVYHWEDPTIPPAYFIDNPYNEIWGWHDEVNQREYAIMGSTLGTHFFDVTDPQNASEVAYVAGQFDDAIHRDYKNKGQYLFAVSDEGQGSLQVIDMSFLPDSVHVIYDSDTLFHRSHNLWIDGDHLYACIPRDVNHGGNFPGLSMYDIRNPANPVLIAEYTNTFFFRVHDLYSRNDTAYLNSEENGLFVVDFTDPLNPQPLSSLTGYPFKGYNHSGWLNEAGDVYVFADETHGMPTKVCEIDQQTMEVEIKSFLHPELATGFPLNDTLTIPHNPLIRGNNAFVSYYYDGIYVFDISDVENPEIVGYYDTYQNANVGFYEGNWGVYPFLPSGLILVSDMQTGLYVLEFDDPNATTSVEESLEGQLRFYPNPASDQVVIKALAKPLTDVSISLFDLQGKQLVEKHIGQLHSTTLNLPEGISQGMYILQVRTAEGKSLREPLIVNPNR